MRFTPLLLMMAVVVLGGCATNGTADRGQQAGSASALSRVYSNAGLQFHLMSAADSPPCADEQCRFNLGFDRQVQRLGQRLAAAAYEAYPDLREQVPNFEFVVAEKAEPGTASNATGTIVVHRGLYKLHLDEEGLAFAIAREMGHVIAGHHEEDSNTGLVISLVAQIIFPVATAVRGAAAILPTNLASYAGTRMAKEHYGPEQAREADAIALKLLARQGWSGQEMDGSLVLGLNALGDDPWSRGFRESVATADTSAYYKASAPPPAREPVRPPASPPEDSPPRGHMDFWGEDDMALLSLHP